MIPKEYCARNILTRSVQSAEIIKHIFHEIKLHIEYCKTFGISIEEMESTPEMQGNRTLPALNRSPAFNI